MAGKWFTECFHLSEYELMQFAIDVTLLILTKAAIKPRPSRVEFKQSIFLDRANTPNMIEDSALQGYYKY